MPVCDFYTVEYYDESGKMTGKAYCGISEQVANTYPVKTVFVDDDAKRFLWWQAYNRLDNTDKKVLSAVFPNILEKDAAKLKVPSDIVAIARAKIRKYFGVPCARCGGSGSYARSVAFTLVDNGICHKCGGFGKQLPRLTDKKVLEMAKFFANKCGAEGNKNG